MAPPSAGPSLLARVTLEVELASLPEALSPLGLAALDSAAPRLVQATQVGALSHLVLEAVHAVVFPLYPVALDLAGSEEISSAERMELAALVLVLSAVAALLGSPALAAPPRGRPRRSMWRSPRRRPPSLSSRRSASSSGCRSSSGSSWFTLASARSRPRSLSCERCMGQLVHRPRGLVQLSLRRAAHALGVWEGVDAAVTSCLTGQGVAPLGAQAATAGRPADGVGRI